MNEGWQFRNRTRDAIVSMLRVVRELQSLAGLRSSEIVRFLISTYRRTGDLRAAAYFSFVFERLQEAERLAPTYVVDWRDRQELERDEPPAAIIFPDAMDVTREFYKRSRRSPVTLRDVELILQIVRELTR